MRLDAKDRTRWSEAELIAMIAILNVERHMEPKCDGCGVGANRPNCAMGGGCGRHEQEDVVAFHKTISIIEKSVRLNELWNWRQHYPLDQVWTLSKENHDLLMDLYEEVVVNGGKHETRTYDTRYRELSEINVVSFSSQYDKWKVSFTPRGQAWAQKLYEEEMK